MFLVETAYESPKQMYTNRKDLMRINHYKIQLAGMAESR